MARFVVTSCVNVTNAFFIAFLLLQTVPTSALAPYTYSNQFTVYETTSSNRPSYPKLTPIVTITKHQDSVNQRFLTQSIIIDEGNEHRYDLRRCDVSPNYMIQTQGAYGTMPAICINSTGTMARCKIADQAVVVVPLDAKDLGPTTVDGQDCNSWQWLDERIQVTNTFYGTKEAPLLLVQTHAPDPKTGEKEYMQVKYTNFTAGQPPISVFAPPTNLPANCTHVGSPPSPVMTAV